MTIWILAIVLFLIWAGLGFLLGFFRTLTLLVGTWVGALLAAPVGNLLMPYLPKIKMTSQFWNDLFAPWIGFFLIQLVFLGIAFVVHWQIAQKMRYRANEITFHKWQRLVSRTGLAVGLVIAFAYLTMVGTSIYALGYATVQVTSESNPPKGFPFLNKMREDIAASGFDKYLASRDETPERFYQTADILGLVYHTPTLMNRLRGYPGVLAINERSEIQDLNNDSDINQLIQQKGDFTELYNNEKIQDLAENESLLNDLAKVDLVDLRNYLETGETDAFEERIVGRWKLDNYLAARENRNMFAGYSVATAKLIRQALLLMDMTMINTLDGDSYLKVNIPVERIQQLVQETLGRNNPPANLAGRGGRGFQPPPRQGARSSEEEELRRFQQQRAAEQLGAGNGGNIQPATSENVVQEVEFDPTVKVNEMMGALSSTSTGKWERDSFQYKITFRQRGQTDTLTARFLPSSGDLVVIDDKSGLRLTFYKN